MTERIYLDTSIAERYFKMIVLSKREKKPILLPYIFHYLKIHPEIKLFTSIFTLAEVFEHLWKIYKLNPKEISELTQNFLKRFNIKLILEFHIKAEVIRWIRKFKLEAKDAIHLSISKENNLCLLTADVDLLIKGRAIHKEIITDKEITKFSHLQ